LPQGKAGDQIATNKDTTEKHVAACLLKPTNVSLTGMPDTKMGSAQVVPLETVMTLHATVTPLAMTPLAMTPLAMTPLAMTSHAAVTPLAMPLKTAMTYNSPSCSWRS
jgi:hypothetical protein